ncbi:MAG: cupin domain-containing protein [Rubrivivax sp.]
MTNHQTLTADELRSRLVRSVNDPDKPFLREPLYQSLGGSLSKGTAARKLAAQVDTVPPGKRTCPYHFHHAEEEMFIVLEGNGTLRVAGQMLPLVAGDVVFIPPGPEYPHHILNTSDAPLKYLSIGTNEPVEVCEYPDSDKHGVFAEHFRTTARRSGEVDYWDGET